MIRPEDLRRQEDLVLDLFETQVFFWVHIWTSAFFHLSRQEIDR